MKYKIVFFLFLVSSHAFSQNLSVPSDGRDFWIGYMYPSFNKIVDSATGTFYGASLLISSYTDNQAQVSYFNRQTGIEELAGTYNLTAKQGIQIPIDLTKVKMSDHGDIPEYAAIHVTSKRAIHIEFFSTGACSGGSFIPLQTACLGRSYVVASYFDNPEGNGAGTAITRDTALGFFEIISAYDGTQVTITPTTRTAGGHIGVNTGLGATGVPHPYTISLGRGQCYLVKSTEVDNSHDISGSLVESNFPIAVISGHENAFIGEAPSQKFIDGRDFMIEQMLPTNIWDSTGYLSIPLYGTQPPNPSAGGYGSNYRVYTDNPKGAQSIIQDCRGPVVMPVDRYIYPQPEKRNIDCPVDLFSTDGHKFSVMLYQLRDQGSKEPFPAESMMGIIPMSRWRRSYLFYVPENPFTVLQDYYINVIGEKIDFDQGNIRYVHSGSGLTKLASPKAAYTTIPNHSELQGATYVVHPGSYYFTNVRTKIITGDPNDSILRGAFTVYNYGMRAVDHDRDLGDMDEDDFFFSYATPEGLKMNNTSHYRIHIDTLCTGWHVCIHDSVFGAKRGIRSITLMDDPNGNEFDTAKQFYNTHLLSPSAFQYSNQINLNEGDSDFCFDVAVNKPVDSAYAPIFISDDEGGVTMLELYYNPGLISLKPNTGNYLYAQLHKDSCLTYVLKNTAAVSNNKADFKVDDAHLKLKTPGFAIANVIPKLPVILHGGDSLIITACYTPTDTLTRRDTLILETPCFANPIDLVGSGGIPIIWASNHDFGAVLIDSTKCDTVGVYNIGKYPFTLTNNWFISNYGLNFTVFKTDSVALQSGIIINPGSKRLFTLCYTPRKEGADSSYFYWSTDQEFPYNRHTLKDSSLLSGHGVSLVGVRDLNTATNQSGFTIYPNPASGNSVIVSFSEIADGIGILTIHDMLGRVVFKKDIYAGISKVVIPLQNLENGIYQIWLSAVADGSKVLRGKLEVIK